MLAQSVGADAALKFFNSFGTVAMFLGVAAMQWFTGWVAALAPALGLDPFVATLAAIAALLLAGAIAYVTLPAPPTR